MTDRNDSTVPTPTPTTPPPWDDTDALRASFGYELRAADRDTLQRVAALVQELARESHQVHQDAPSGVLVAGLQAAVADLQHLGGFFAFLASFTESASLNREDARLALLASAQAPRVAEVAEELEAALPAA